MEDLVSERVVAQRIRNNVIDVLETSASFEAQVEYQLKVTFVYIPNEILEQWGDWVTDDPRIQQPIPLIEGLYSSAEIAAMADFHDVWLGAFAATTDRAELSIVQTRPEWLALRDAARSALEVFQVRGRMPQDQEVAWPA